MRIFIFFDLPVETDIQRKAYRKFRKFLKRDGYVMLQESVYSKLAINQTSLESAVHRLEKSKPDKGLVQYLTITEKQFSSIENLVGMVVHNEVVNTERLVIL